jgi:hypothetical protein
VAQPLSIPSGELSKQGTQVVAASHTPAEHAVPAGRAVMEHDHGPQVVPLQERDPQPSIVHSLPSSQMLPQSKHAAPPSPSAMQLGAAAVQPSSVPVALESMHGMHVAVGVPEPTQYGLVASQPVSTPAGESSTQVWMHVEGRSRRSVTRPSALSAHLPDDSSSIAAWTLLGLVTVNVAAGRLWPLCSASSYDG